jgi:hypothetical protein
VYDQIIQWLQDPQNRTLGALLVLAGFTILNWLFPWKLNVKLEEVKQSLQGNLAHLNATLNILGSRHLDVFKWRAQIMRDTYASAIRLKTLAPVLTGELHRSIREGQSADQVTEDELEKVGWFIKEAAEFDHLVEREALLFTDEENALLADCRSLLKKLVNTTHARLLYESRAQTSSEQLEKVHSRTLAQHTISMVEQARRNQNEILELTASLDRTVALLKENFAKEFRQSMKFESKHQSK